MYVGAFAASPLSSSFYMKGPCPSFNGDTGKSGRSLRKHGHLRDPKKESTELELQLGMSEILMTPMPNNDAFLASNRLPPKGDWAAVIQNWGFSYYT